MAICPKARSDDGLVGLCSRTHIGVFKIRPEAQWADMTNGLKVGSPMLGSHDDTTRQVSQNSDHHKASICHPQCQRERAVFIGRSVLGSCRSCP
jgi:hypothetical protein